MPDGELTPRKRLIYLRKRLRDDALVGAAISCLAALAAGLLVNQISDGSTRTSLTIAAAGSATVSLVVGWLSSRTFSRLAKESAYRASDKLTIQKMLSWLDRSLDRESTRLALSGSFEVSLSIQRPGDQGEQQVEPASAFVASSVSDLRCSFVIGEAGAGKSTVLQRLAIRILMDARHTETSRRAIYLESRTWAPGLALDAWAIRAATMTYGAEASTIGRWFRTSRCVLVIDGLDEMRPENSEKFIAASNAWLDTSGGVAIFSCRPDDYSRVFHRIRHEQVARLQPVSWSATAESVRQSSATPLNDSDLFAITRLLGEDEDGLTSPMLVQMLLSAATKQVGASSSSEEGSIVSLARRLETEGNLSEAARLYRYIVEQDEQALGSDASIQLCLLLARSGNLAEARRLLHEAVAAKLEFSLQPATKTEEITTSAAEIEILGVLGGSRALDEAQISAMCSIPPSRVAQAVDQLTEKGLVEVVPSRSGPRRFRRLTLDMAS